MEDMGDTADTGAMEGTGDMVDTDTAAKNERQLQLQSQMLMLMHIMDMVVMEAMEDTEGMVDMDMDARNDLRSPIMVMGAMVVTEVMVAMAVAMEAMVDTDTGVKSRTK